MAPSEPTTPVRVPKAVATYTLETQDPGLRSDLNSILLRDGHITKIQETLLHTLHTTPQNWPTQIQSHALSLLRSGTCTSFPSLLARVLEDVRADQKLQSQFSTTNPSTTNSTSTQKNGNGVNGKKAGGGGNGEGEMKGRGENGVSLALPRTVVDEGVRITRECLEGVCEMD